MAEASARVNGTQRAAIFLLSLGESDAASVMKHMGAKDVQRVGAAMVSMKNVSRDQVESVFRTFADSVREETSLGVGADDYVRNVLVQALGDDKAGALVDRIVSGGQAKGLDALNWMEPKAITDLVRNEHPQIIAIVLSYIDEEQAGNVLRNLPEKLRSEVVMRIATLDGIQPAALAELDEIIEKQFAKAGNMQASPLGGAKRAAGILNMLESGMDEEVLRFISKNDADLGNKISDLMFTFDTLLQVDDRGVQELLREISMDTLAVALKGADDVIRDKFLRNISKRASEILQDDLETKGPVRLSEVEAAQKEILGVARRMADQGQIAMGGRGERYV